VDFSKFLSHSDAARAQGTLARLRAHRIEPLVLTGGLAIELHWHRFGFPAQLRPLNDIDFLVNSFDEIPRTLGVNLLFRHVHPSDPPARTLLQCIDPETAVRVDIFRTYGNIVNRAIPVALCGITMRMVSVEDLIARTARLCMDLRAGEQMPAKHARDFLRVLPLADRDEVEPAWQEHRKPNHPRSFVDAANLLQDLIGARRDLQIVPVYSQDVSATCSRCKPTQAFPLADATRVLSLLGYC
jgi:hypothetical protein